MAKEILIDAVTGKVTERTYDVPVVDASVVAAEQMSMLRFERDRLLAETDWWCLSDQTPTQARLDYRQVLRDLPANYSSLETAVFPVKP
tara:strand:+ start:1512 stop:1778 length:267 start_codon:yes stop_codon:yes gene_type:complete